MPTSQYLSRLMSRGDHHGVARLAASLHQRERDTITAETIFQIVLAYRIIGFADLATEWQVFAETKPDYTERMRGDFLRDVALDLIRRSTGPDDRSLTEAHELLDQVLGLHRDDPNRAIMVQAARARLAYASGHVTRAFSMADAASRRWHQLGHDADMQWVRNNRFHLMAFAQAAGVTGLPVRTARDILRDKGENDPCRKQLARVFVRDPRRGLTAYYRALYPHRTA